MRMSETTEYMKQLGVTPALFKKWQAEDVEADEPAPFQTQHDALILVQRRQAARGEAVSPFIGEHVMVEGRLMGHARATGHAPAGVNITFKEVITEVPETAGVPVVSKEARVVEEVVVGRNATDRIETVHGTVHRADIEVEQVVEKERARER